MQENTDQNNSEYEYFLHSAKVHKRSILLKNYVTKSRSFSQIIDKYLIDFFQNNYADSDFEHLFDKIECL